MSKSNKVRQAELKARRESEGKVKRPYWATPPEHELINSTLLELRFKKESPNDK
jgi:hypothetical protein